MKILSLNKKFLFLTLLFMMFSTNENAHAENSNFKNDNLIKESNELTFSRLEDIVPKIDQNSYFDFLRSSIIDQPEFLYANSNLEEKNQNLKLLVVIPTKDMHIIQIT